MEAATMHPNARRMLQVIESFNRGDFSGVSDVFAEDAVWHAAGRNRHSGDHRGEQIGRWFAAMGAMGCSVEPIDLMADDTHVAFFIRVRSDEAGHELDQIHVNAMRFVDGKATEGWFLPDDQEAWDRWAGE